MQLKISIVVAVYNVEEYLTKCIESICMQSYKRLQIILVDDGSSDCSGEICDDWCQKDNRIIVIHQNNQGLVKCRKTGLKAVDGEYVVLVDGDDYLEPDMIEVLINEMLLSNADIVNCGFYIGKDGVNVPDLQITITENNRVQCLSEHIFDLQSEQKIYSSIWSKLFKTEVIKTAYINVSEDCSVGEDLLNLIFCFKQNVKFVSIDRPLYHYVQRNTSLMNQRNNDYYRKRLPFVYQLVKLMSEYEYDEELQRKLDIYVKNELKAALRRSTKDIFAIQQYRIASIEQFYGKDIILYGAGDVGKDFYSQLMMDKQCILKAWVDVNADKMQGLSVVGLEALLNTNYDIIILATNEYRIAQNMKKTLKSAGVAECKIIWADRIIVD